jgi:hypothetical protein
MAGLGVIVAVTGFHLALGRTVWDLPALGVSALFVCYGLMSGWVSPEGPNRRVFVWIGLCGALGLALGRPSRSSIHGTRMNERESPDAV